MKLDIELVPKQQWGRNLRSMLSAIDWMEVSQLIRGDGVGACEICEKLTSTLDCHEVWEYNDADRTQSLVTLRAVCHDCHRVIHLGRTRIQAVHHPKILELAIDHFLTVNNVSPHVFRTYKDEVFAIWARRSNIVYRLVIDPDREEMRALNPRAIQIIREKIASRNDGAAKGEGGSVLQSDSRLEER